MDWTPYPSYEKVLVDLLGGFSTLKQSAQTCFCGWIVTLWQKHKSAENNLRFYYDHYVLFSELLFSSKTALFKVFVLSEKQPVIGRIIWQKCTKVFPLKYQISIIIISPIIQLLTIIIFPIINVCNNFIFLPLLWKMAC